MAGQANSGHVDTHPKVAAFNSPHPGCTMRESALHVSAEFFTRVTLALDKGWDYVRYNGMLVPVRTRFGLRRCGGKTYNVST